MNGSTNTSTITIPARIFFHNLLAPYSQRGNPEDAKYSVTMLISKDDPEVKNRIDAALDAAREKGIQGKWNGIAPQRPAIPLYDGDDVRANGERFSQEAAGMYVLTASSREKPEIVDTALQPISDESAIYRGAYIYASITFFSYSRSGKKGIGCAINAVMKHRDAEPFEGGKVTAAQAFTSVIRQLATTNAGPPPFEAGQTTMQTITGGAKI